MIKLLISAAAAWQKAVADGKHSEGDVGGGGGEVVGWTLKDTFMRRRRRDSLEKMGQF